MLCNITKGNDEKKSMVNSPLYEKYNLIFKAIGIRMKTTLEKVIFPNLVLLKEVGRPKGGG